jgi:hypothetical protein
MAEKIVSPGVFTRETDLSFLPQGIAGIGAAFIGPTLKGPAMVPTSVSSFAEFAQIFGNTNPNLYLPYAAKEYLDNSSQLTIVRTLHDDGYKVSNPVAIVVSGSFGRKHIGLIHPSQTVLEGANTYSFTSPTSMFEKSALSANSSGSAVIKLSGSYTIDSDFSATVSSGATGASYSASLNSSNANYLSKVFSRIPTVANAPGYLYTLFDVAAASAIAADTGSLQFELQSGSFYTEADFSEATTPWIISQTVNNTNQNLFKFHTIAAGNSSNYEVKVAISNIKPAGSVAGSEYGSFVVTIRAVDQTYLRAIGSPYDTTDTDARPNILEVFDNVNLDPNSTRYIARVIGDRYKTFTSGKVVLHGDYPNKSNFVYVEVDNNVANGVISSELVPFGFAALFNPLPTSFTNIPAATYVAAQEINSIYNKRKHFGFDFDFGSTDNANYLKVIPVSSSIGSNVPFLLSNYNQHASANYPSTTPYSGSINLTDNTSVDTRKFVVPFQGGFDGVQPNKRILSGTDIKASNTQGYDLSGTSGKDYSVYTNAIDSVSNPDEIDINMIVLPGVLQKLHPTITDYVRSMCQDRGDVFNIFDTVGIGGDAGSTIAEAIETVSTLDDNYSATYYPWVKIVDANINKPVWVMPSVVLPGVLAFNDKVAAEWYAPAGLNRGGLTSVIDAYTRLTQTERDTLYEGRVNPIATFPGQGVAVWGQKTLQAKPSALDRINVRRLLIAVKKYIASTSKYLVFEQNTAATRNRFLNIVNPYLESVQQRQGLYAFKVVMDETNNTPDVIDRNILKGSIFLQPAKSAEFIVIDFNVLPTGASFPGA